MFASSLLKIMALASVAVAASVRSSSSSSVSTLVYVGSYDNAINVYSINDRTGNLTLVHEQSTGTPSFLAFAPGNKHLYACNELNGTYSSFSVLADGSLSALNTVAAEGDSPAHVAVHPNGKYVLATSYAAAKYWTYDIEASGAIGKANNVITDPNVYGASGLPVTDHDAAHAHEMIAAPNSNIVLGVDLGIDRVNVFELGSSGQLTLAGEIQFAKASGPRHGAFNSDGSFVYIGTEEDNTVVVLKQHQNGQFESVQNATTLPSGFNGTSYIGEVRFSHDFKTLYVSNRVADANTEGSVAVFTVKNNGELELIQVVGSQGYYPRGFNIEPQGQFAYVGNQNSNQIGIYRVIENGKLQPLGTYDQPSPVDFEFLNIDTTGCN